MWLFLVLGVIFAFAIMLCCDVFSLLFIEIIREDIKEWG